MCVLFVFVDLGKPTRLMNIILYPTPGSILFWDVVVLNGYLGLNIVISWTVLGAERKWVKPPAWVKPLIYISIPWAVSIHTVTAFLYAGLPGRHLWLTAIMAARFLSSAFAGGPALLIILALIVRRFTKFDPGKEAIQKLALIVTYALIINMFFLGLEFFTAFYSGIPSHQHSLDYLYVGLDGHVKLVPWMWASGIMCLAGIVLLLFPRVRRAERILGWTCVMIFLGLWIDKGLGLVVGGFIPNPLDQIREYSPTLLEVTITFAIWALGFLVLTILYKVAIGVKEETGGELAPH
jgi:molybdopterin-containing oxidoreductase family membrane subunit